MTKLMNGEDILTGAEQNEIDKQIDSIAPYLNGHDDELPIFDIMVDRATKPGWFRGSVAIFLPDKTIQAHAESPSVNTAIKQAFNKVTRKVLSYTHAKRDKSATLHQIFSQAV